MSKTLKKLIFVLFLIILQSCEQQTGFTLLSGDKKRLSDYQDQWLLVNFWAEWCPPCLKEIPELNALQDSGVAVVAVSYDKLSNSELRAQKEKYGIRYAVVATEPMPYLPMAKPQGLPANYLFTPSGEMIGPLLGKQDKNSIMELINKIEATTKK